jgi:hypothetical protein
MPDSSSPSGDNVGAPPPPAAAGDAGTAPSPMASLPRGGPPRSPSPPRSRSREWGLIVAAAALAWPLWTWRGTVSEAGTVVDVPITLVTSDRADLDCALGSAVGRYRCGFRSPGQAWPDPPASAERLAPYFTSDRRLFLVPALFEQPALAARYAREPPANVPRDRLRRFVVRCKLRLVGRIDDVQARWLSTGTWGPAGAAWVAEPGDCRLDNG